MKIYLVWLWCSSCCDDGNDVIGVFLTRRAAENCVDLNQYRVDGLVYRKIEIIEYVLDEYTLEFKCD